MPESALSFAHSEFAGLIGVARRDITPPIGIYARNWGAATHDTAEGVHRPFTATALTLQGQPPDAPLVLIALDLGWWRSRADEWYVRGGVIDSLSLDPARVMINMAHTHAGPSLCRDDADQPGGDLIAPYLAQVREAVIEAAREALATCRAATLSWGQGTCALAQNRDLPDPQLPRFLCGFHPDGAADDTLLVGRIATADGTPLATLVNYACHPVTLGPANRLLSPDFVGAMREVVEAHTSQAPCLFLQGASGELSPREAYGAETAVADAYGRALGFAALSVLEGMLPPRTGLTFAGAVESGAPLACWTRTAHAPSSALAARQVNVELDLRPLPSLAEIERQLARRPDRAQEERLRRKRQVRRSVGDGPAVSIPVWLWRIGDALLIGHPNEAYSRLQTELRGEFAPHAVGVMNIVNGWSGYLPPAELYDQDLYAVWQSPFERGSLERLIERCRETARSLVRPDRER